jgi:very-short-patch-repair endonuclease
MDYKREFEKYKIPCIVIHMNGEYFFKASDIAKYLNIKNPRGINITSSEKIKLKSQTNGGNQNVAFLTVNGLKELLVKTRKCNARVLAQIFGIDLNVETILCDEAQTLSRIQTVFADEEMIEQYQVGNYRIDLYFPKYKIAIECDEMHHDQKINQINDKLREQYIKEKIGCSFIRYRPSDDIFQVLHHISLRIRKSQLEELCMTIKNLHNAKVKINDFVHSLYTPTDLSHEDIITSKQFRELRNIE